MKAILPIRSKTLPDGSLFSGRGNRPTLVHRLSERNLVKKIAASIRRDELDDGTEETEDLESIFNTSNSSFGFDSDSSFGFLSSDSDSDSDSEREDDDSSEDFTGPSLSAVQHIFPGNCTMSDSSSKQVNKELWENTASPIPHFHRKELGINENLLGCGAFSQVYAIKSICLNLKDHQSHKESTQKERFCLVKKSLENKASLVIKHLNRKLLRKPKEFKAAAMDLEWEAKILTLARHPNIIRLRGMSLGGSATAALADSGKFNDFFLVLDRLSDTLDKRILRWKEEPNSYPGVATIAAYSQQLSSALAYLHDHRLIFRDLKPQNIGFIAPSNTNTSASGTGNIIAGQDRLQLFDFGLCRSLPPQQHANQETFHMSLAGTTRYMAPEILRQEAYNCKADVYGWAVVVWETLEHRSKPYDSIRPKHFIQLVSELDIRPGMDGGQWEHVPEAFKQLLQDAWCASPQDRLSMSDVFHQLTPILQRLQKVQADCSSSSISDERTCTTQSSSTEEVLETPRQSQLSDSSRDSWI